MSNAGVVLRNGRDERGVLNKVKRDGEDFLGPIFLKTRQRAVS